MEGTESFCAESIEWKSRSQRSGGGAGAKLVLRSAAEEDELDRFVSVCTKSDKLQLLSGTYELQYSNVLNS